MSGTISAWPVVKNGSSPHPVKTLQYLLQVRGLLYYVLPCPTPSLVFNDPPPARQSGVDEHRRRPGSLQVGRRTCCSNSFPYPTG